MLRMEENECFNDFEIKLMDIVNQSYQLCDPYSDRRIKQKIMRSFPERFESKVTVLEENNDYKDIKPSEVIRRLLAYESRKVLTSTPPKKQKRIALKASKVEKEDNDNSDEDMTLLLRRFKKFVKFEKKGDDSDKRDESSDDDYQVANFIVFASSHNSKDVSEKEEESQEENDSSDDDSSSNSTNGNVESIDVHDYIVKFESSRMKNKMEIQRLKVENLELSTKVTHLGEGIVTSKKLKDKLREEIVLANRNEARLEMELEDAREIMAKMASNMEKLDHFLSVGKSPIDKTGLRIEDDKEISTLNETVFVKSLSNKEALPLSYPRKKIDLGQCSHSVEVKVAPKSQAQA
ncbi:hypothetical protein LWI28_008758 [Acer negundo]|uniref:Uncharacterized protein n=1 Tax=Acer negundo TaxID=4023 RepID=A0AAD5ILW1_ACENE|nr:hypothetical protein LWI28_008758 [Acer negundo]